MGGGSIQHKSLEAKERRMTMNKDVDNDEEVKNELKLGVVNALGAMKGRIMLKE